MKDHTGSGTCNMYHLVSFQCWKIFLKGLKNIPRAHSADTVFITMALDYINIKLNRTLNLYLQPYKPLKRDRLCVKTMHHRN